jgi:serine/threonine-protein kinase
MVPQHFVGLLNNRYQIVRLLGQGGWGAVYEARDVVSNFTVALKQNLATDPASVSQFQTEGAILARLNHPNLPRVYDYFTDATGAQFIAMEFVAGHHLEAIVRQRGAVNEAQARVWFDQILDALMYLHTHGIIHRDIKPQNIIITPQGRALLVDFGIAKVHQTGRPTATGARGVTPGFSPPEQYGGGTDRRSDLYALGATLYFVLTGIVPPESPDLITGNATLIPPRQITPALAPGVQAVILRAMQEMSAQRFQSAFEMRTALATLVVPPAFTQPLAPIAANRIWIAALAVFVLMCFLFACGATLFMNRERITIAFLGTTTPTRTLTPSITPSLTATRTPTITQSATATETPTASATPTITPSQTPTLEPTWTPTPSLTPTDPPCSTAQYPAFTDFPSTMRRDRVETIIRELTTWMWIDQHCIWQTTCTTLHWDAKPENISEIWPDPNPSYKLVEKLADNPAVIFNIWDVKKSDSRQVCPAQNMRYALWTQTRKGHVAVFGYVIVWQR